MSYNKSPLAFADIREAFERALSSPRGIRIPCENRAAAVVLRSRFNYLRKLDRQANTKIYDPDHPMWNHSIYDKLVLRIPQRGTPEEATLYVEPRITTNLQIEEIP